MNLIFKPSSTCSWVTLCHKRRRENSVPSMKTTLWIIYIPLYGTIKLTILFISLFKHTCASIAQELEVVDQYFSVSSFFWKSHNHPPPKPVILDSSKTVWNQIVAELWGKWSDSKDTWNISYLFKKKWMNCGICFLFFFSSKYLLKLIWLNSNIFHIRTKHEIDLRFEKCDWEILNWTK